MSFASRLPHRGADPERILRCRVAVWRPLLPVGFVSRSGDRSYRGRAVQAVKPPSAMYTEPVIQALSSLARNSITLAISSGVP